MEIRDYLEKTDARHSDLIDAFAYGIAVEMAKLKDEYVLLYIKKRPKYIPKFLYKWLCNKLLVLALFDLV